MARWVSNAFRPLIPGRKTSQRNVFYLSIRRSQTAATDTQFKREKRGEYLASLGFWWKRQLPLQRNLRCHWLNRSHGLNRLDRLNRLRRHGWLHTSRDGEITRRRRSSRLIARQSWRRSGKPRSVAGESRSVARKSGSLAGKSRRRPRSRRHCARQTRIPLERRWISGCYRRRARQRRCLPRQICARRHSIGEASHWIIQAGRSVGQSRHAIAQRRVTGKEVGAAQIRGCGRIRPHDRRLRKERLRIIELSVQVGLRKCSLCK